MYIPEEKKCSGLWRVLNRMKNINSGMKESFLLLNQEGHREGRDLEYVNLRDILQRDLENIWVLMGRLIGEEKVGLLKRFDREFDEAREMLKDYGWQGGGGGLEKSFVLGRILGLGEREWAAIKSMEKPVLLIVPGGSLADKVGKLDESRFSREFGLMRTLCLPGVENEKWEGGRIKAGVSIVEGVRYVSKLPEIKEMRINDFKSGKEMMDSFREKFLSVGGRMMDVHEFLILYMSYIRAEVLEHGGRMRKAHLGEEQSLVMEKLGKCGEDEFEEVTVPYLQENDREEGVRVQIQNVENDFDDDCMVLNARRVVRVVAISKLKVGK